MTKLIVTILFGWWLYLIFTGVEPAVIIGLAATIVLVETSERKRRR